MVSSAERAGDGGDAAEFRQALLRLSTDVAGYRSLDELCRALATHLTHVVPFDHLGLLLVDQDTGVVRVAVIEPSQASAGSTTKVKLRQTAGPPETITP